MGPAKSFHVIRYGPVLRARGAARCSPGPVRATGMGLNTKTFAGRPEVRGGIVWVVAPGPGRPRHTGGIV